MNVLMLMQGGQLIAGMQLILRLLHIQSQGLFPNVNPLNPNEVKLGGQKLTRLTKITVVQKYRYLNV